jgi:hypothetical protein
LSGCWILSHKRIAGLFRDLGLADLTPRLLFVRASAKAGFRVSAQIESFDDDPLPAREAMEAVAGCVDRWLAAASRAKAKAQNEILDAVFNAFSSIDSDLTPRCRHPVVMEGHFIVPVLMIRKSGMRSVHRSLERGSSPESEISPALDLVLVVLEQLLTDIAAAIRDSEFVSIDLPHRDPSDVLRRAGRALSIQATAGLASDLGQLYDVCNAISALPYEHRQCLGDLVIATAADARVSSTVVLRERIPFEREEARSVRKLLESTSSASALLCDAQTVYGLGQERLVESSQRLRRVKFSGHGSWSLLVGDDTIMHVRDGVPGLPMAPVNEGRFRNAVCALQPELATDALPRLMDLVRAAARTDHGVILVFAKDPTRAVQDLGPQCMAVEPFVLTADRLTELSRVDGAIVLGLDGQCHAFGAILDGRAAPSLEDRSRGARYNSAVRYVAQSAGTAIAIVVSSDRMANVVDGTGQ